MGIYLANGYGIWKPTLTLDGTTKIFQTSILFKYEGSSGVGAAGTSIRNSWTQSGAPFNAAQMYVGYTLARSETYLMLGGVQTYDLFETPVIGTKATGLGTPINTSILINKITGLVGKRYRGRCMLPNMWVPEGSISQAGIIDAGALSTAQALFTTVFNTQQASSYPQYLGHSVSEIAPTAMTTFLVGAKVGSMPHRIRGY